MAASGQSRPKQVVAHSLLVGPKRTPSLAEQAALCCKSLSGALVGKHFQAHRLGKPLSAKQNQRLAANCNPRCNPVPSFRAAQRPRTPLGLVREVVEAAGEDDTIASLALGAWEWRGLRNRTD